MKKILAAIAASALLLMVSAQPVPWNSAQITCTAPTAFTDGTLIGSAVISYKFQRRVQGQTAWTNPQTASTCAYTYTNLPIGTHEFTAIAIVAGIESGISNIGSKTIARIPNTPTALEAL